ncbi:hypothetical protein AGMMS49543_26590 [Betaproteobacteria bacterium]|nr:hypothetical protein AGMMS49543_26590 [Betaproteobacteria bacterium]
MPLLPFLLSAGGLAYNAYSDWKNRQEREKDRGMVQNQINNQRTDNKALLEEMRSQMSPEALRQRADIDLDYQTKARELGQDNMTGYTGDIRWEKDANGKNTMVSNLSPQEQRKYELQNQLAEGIGTAAQGLSNNKYSDEQFAIQQKRMNPIFEQELAGLTQDLNDRGISPLNKGYQDALQRMRQSHADTLRAMSADATREGSEIAARDMNTRLGGYTALTPNSPVNSFVPNVGGTISNPYGNSNNYAQSQQGMMGNMAANMNNTNTANAMNMYNMNNQAALGAASNRASNFRSLMEGLWRPEGFGSMFGGGGIGTKMNQNKNNGGAQ